jgi:hypothetical protein
MPKPKHTKIVINDYMQHWIISTESGCEIRICDGKDNTWKIYCNWKTYKRTGVFSFGKVLKK